MIYPMNALATDQARRFAEVIASTPAFAGLRVGLFVGGNLGQPGSGMVMSPTSVITDRETMRKTPPDVLLTNYKMLDYLLLRPKDRQLWARNSPETLRYVVVDELHTFDGAQGTDLALLLRRLRARLQAPEGRSDLRRHVGHPWHLVRHRAHPRVRAAGVRLAVSGTRRYRSRTACRWPSSWATPRSSTCCSRGTISATCWIPHATCGRKRRWPRGSACSSRTRRLRPTCRTPHGASRLGERLKRHLLFVNLLKLVKGGVIEYADLLQQMQGPLPANARPHIREVLDALLVLVAWARAEDGSRPFVTLRLQVWIKELRRMVARVAAAPDAVDLRSDADLAAAPGALYLPLVQCSECHTTGWLSRVAPGTSKVSTKRDEIYNTWFARRPEAVRLYPGPRLPRREVDGRDQHLCASCGNLQELGGEVRRVRAHRAGAGLSHDWHADQHARQSRLHVARHHVPDLRRARPPVAGRRAQCDARLPGGGAELGQRLQRR